MTVESSSSRVSFEGWCEVWWPRAHKLARLLTGSSSVGEEIAQEAFLSLHRRWNDLEEPAAYLRTTVVNLARSHHRRQYVRRRHVPEPPAVVFPPEIDETWKLICRLPMPQRSVLVLRFYEDLTLAEIASVTGRPVGTVKALLHRALARLRKDLR